MADPEITANIGSLDPLPDGEFEATDLFEVERPRADPDPNDNYRATFAELTAAVAASLPPSDAAQTGDVLITARDPGAGWLQCGHIYSQSTYPDLFDVVGLISDGPPGEAWISLGNTGRAVVRYANIDRDRIIGVGNGVIWRSYDGGITWSSESVAWNLTGVWVTYSGVWITYGTGAWRVLMRSTDGGETFAEVTRPTTDSGEVHHVTEQAGRVFVTAGVGSTSKVYYSDDAGTTWTAPSSANGIHLLPLGNGVIVALGDTSTGVRISTNNGTTWATGTSLPGNGPVAGVSSYSNGKGMAVVAGSGGLFRTTDYGSTWTTITGGLSGPGAGSVVEVDGRLIQLARNNLSTHRYSDNDGVSFVDSGITSTGSLMTFFVGRLGLEAATSGGTNAQRSPFKFSYDTGTQFLIPRVDGLQYPLSAFMRA